MDKRGSRNKGVRGSGGNAKNSTGRTAPHANIQRGQLNVNQRKRKVNPLNVLLRLLLLCFLTILNGTEKLVTYIQNFFKNMEPRAKVAASVGGIILFAMVAVLIVILATVRPNAFQINLEGTAVGIINMRQNTGLDDEGFANFISERLMVDYQGEAVRILSRITVAPIRSSNVRELSQVLDDIVASPRLIYQVEIAIINIDGEEAAILRNRAEAEGLLSEIGRSMALSIGQDNLGAIVHSGFLEDVAIVSEFRYPNSHMNMVHARNILTRHEIVRDIHIVQSGENLTTIRNRYGMSEQEILLINPQIANPHMMNPGMAIYVDRPRPILTVITVLEVVREEDVPFGSREFPDPNRQRGQRETVSHGVDGRRAITEHLTYRNTNLHSRIPISTFYILEPVDEQIVYGTRN
ncbi:MAG: G5 domain-containing protein [Defluviitaleaceae bacterium]|nr:G5 domain-containing protein [Defluviitaleaceae bacterium]